MARRRKTADPPERRPARWRSPARVKALLASAARVDRKSAAELRRLTQEWQGRALSYYDICGEARFPAEFHANSLAQIRLYPGYREGSEIEETDDEGAVELMDRIHDPGSSGRSMFQASYGRLMFITGEGYALVTRGEDEDGESWEFVSTDELRIDSQDRYSRIKAPGIAPVPLTALPDDAFEPLDDNQCVAYRFWRRHPRYSSMADSPMHAVLDLYEELKLLELAVRARVKSRLASSGILVMSDEITLMAPDAQADPRNPQDDVFVREFIEHVTAGITDEGSASAFVPLLMRVNVPPERRIQDLISLMKLHDPNETYRETGLRTEAIERIAIGIDLPPEILKGIGDSNHWSAWAIDDQVAKAHIFPVAQMLCNDLTKAYLRPIAKDEGISNWENLVVGFDAAELVVNPDQSSNARELYDREEIGGDSLRDAHGFDESDKPTEEDLRRWAEKRAVNATAKRDDAGDPEGRDTDQVEPPNPDLTAAAVPPPSVVPDHVARVVGAGEMALERARELAGARVRALKRSCPDCFDGTDDLPNRGLVAALGPDRLAAMNAPAPAALVAGGCELLSAKLAQWGIADDWASAIVEQIERHAARTIFDTDPQLPSGFAQIVERLPEAA